MPEEVTADGGREVVSRYFEADARRDDDAILALFADDAVVTDERRAWRGSAEIRDWRHGPVSKYEYTTTLASIDRIDHNHYRASGRIDGNFPGGTAALTWNFLLVEGLISRLEIAP
jgi:ketosteroid isomerase-like protein